MLRICQRSYHPSVYQHYVAMGLDPMMAQLLAGRLVGDDLPLDALLSPKLAHLTSPALFLDIEPATQRIIKALEAGEVIALETDHDCDGQTAHAVLYTAFIEHFGHPPEKTLSFIGHRLEEGYGLSDALATRILSHQPRPTLVITADNGSSDEPRIARLQAAGIEVIVTDHHEVPTIGVPKSAFAVINPVRPGCPYPDKSIAGCMVAWLLMAEVRSQLIKKGLLSQNSPSLAALLDFVAVGTVADCVSLADSVNNRAVVRYGLQLIQKAQRPCWRAIQPLLKGPVTSLDLGFVIGPLLNSDGRLSDALTSVSFLLAKTDQEAHEWVTCLSEQNEARKKIQNTMTYDAHKQALIQVNQGCYSICLFLEEGHPGVHGISASRVKDAFGRPTIIFSPKKNHPDLITGSARSIDGFHIRQALEVVADKMPEGIVSFGGHKGAAGVTIKKDFFPRFVETLEEATRALLGTRTMGPVIWTDGSLSSNYFTVDFARQIETLLQPFGRAFEPPTFEDRGVVRSIQPVGNGLHVKVHLQVGHQSIHLIWFQARLQAEDPLPLIVGDDIHFAYRLQLNDFRGVVRLSPQMIGCSKID